MGNERSFRKNIFIVFILTVAAKLTAFVTEVIIAKYLGTTYQADAYSMVYGIHYIVYPMLSVGLWKAFMPEYNRVLVAEGDDSANRFANSIFTSTLGVGVIVAAFIMLYARNIVNIVAPGFDEQTAKLCSELVFISAPQYIFVLLAAFYTAFLQSKNSFFVSTLKDSISYVPLIVLTILFYDRYGIKTLAIGIVLGGLARMLVQVLFIRDEFKPDFSFSFDKYVKNVVIKLPPLLLITAIYDLNVYVTKAIASMVGIGAVSSLNYSQRVSNVVVGLTAGVLSVVLFPKFAKLSASKKIKELSDLLITYTSLLVTLLVPFTIITLMYSKDIIRLLFMRGNFDEKSVFITAGAFSAYMVGVIFVGLNSIYDNFYYSYGNVKVPLFISIMIVIVNILLSFRLSEYYGISGLALSNTISVIVGTIMLFVLLDKFVDFEYRIWFKENFKICLAGIVAYFFIQYLLSLRIIVLCNYFLVIIFLLLVYFCGLVLLKVKVLKAMQMELRKLHLKKHNFKI